MQEQEEIRAGARDEGYREGYAQGTAKALDDAVKRAVQAVECIIHDGPSAAMNKFN